MKPDYEGPTALGAYQCPGTRQSLRLNGTHVVTLDGIGCYPLRDECIVFLKHEHTEDDTELGKIRMALTRSHEVGWQCALDETYASGTAHHRYLNDDNRTAFLDLLPLSPQSVILEIGCSMGQHTETLAAKCRMVYGLDVVLEQCLFTKERLRQQKVTNVSIACGGDDGILPYQSEMFDIVVCNLVFEWCGSRSTEEHDVIHKRLLNEISRTLKPGGRLFLNTKNRYDVSLLAGGRDIHMNGIRFGSALPRRVASWILHRKNVKKSVGWLHSYRELRNAVRGAGFSAVQSYWAAPEMRYPRHYIPTDASSVRTARRSLKSDVGSNRLQRWCLSMMPAALVKYFTPGLCLVAKK